jgi:Cysteine-rich CPXCG
MTILSEQPVSCPYCGEGITVLVDQSLPDHEYIEDCQVCCRPIVLCVSVETDGGIAVSAKSENE